MEFCGRSLWLCWFKRIFLFVFQGQCEPMTYKPIVHADHGEDLRHFRRKSKSWIAGEKPSTNRSHKFMKSRFSLDFQKIFKTLSSAISILYIKLLSLIVVI